MRKKTVQGLNQVNGNTAQLNISGNDFYGEHVFKTAKGNSIGNNQVNNFKSQARTHIYDQLLDQTKDYRETARTKVKELVPNKTRLSTTGKVALGVGAAALVGGGIYAATRNKNNNKY